MAQEGVFLGRSDRLGKFLKPRLKALVFGEFSQDFLSRAKLPEALKEAMAGVPIPLQQGDLRSFASAKGLAPDRICENMVQVMGADPDFPYIVQYKAYLASMFDDGLVMALLEMAQKAMDKEDYEDACIHVRAALLIAPEEKDTLYAYAMVTRAMYLEQEGEDAEYVGRCKAESMTYLELVAQGFPQYAPTYYYLGYAYLNLGLYIKAKLTWEEYLTKTTDGETRQEIEERLVELEDPVVIEEGINDAGAERYEWAIRKLEPYLNSKYAQWWPLHFYLAMSFAAVGEWDKAEKSYLEVLKCNPSHIDSMEALSSLYEAIGQDQKAEKYRRKVEVVKKGYASGHKPN